MQQAKLGISIILTNALVFKFANGQMANSIKKNKKNVNKNRSNSVNVIQVQAAKTKVHLHLA